MKRDLLYHCTPLPGFEQSLEQLERYLHLFDGHRFMAVAYNGPGLWTTADEGRAMMWGVKHRVGVISVNNDPDKRESASLKPLLNALHDAGPSDLFFYAHSKGLTRGWEPPTRRKSIQLWIQAMYHHNLDRINDVEKMFENGNIHTVGAFKCNKYYSNFPRECKFHYSGTFYWVRCSEFFKRDWQILDDCRYCTEGMPGLIFDHTEAGCIFADNIRVDPYDLRSMQRILGGHIARPERVRAPFVDMNPKGPSEEEKKKYYKITK